MVNLSSTTYKYRAVTEREEGGWRKRKKRKPGGQNFGEGGKNKKQIEGVCLRGEELGQNRRKRKRREKGE
jgi:hypothetical protein